RRAAGGTRRHLYLLPQHGCGSRNDCRLRSRRRDRRRDRRHRDREIVRSAPLGPMTGAEGRPVPGIFLSYARETASTVEALAADIGRLGYATWLDQDL